jgi:hypothetical protein
MIKCAVGYRVSRRGGCEQNQQNSSNDCSQHFGTSRNKYPRKLISTTGGFHMRSQIPPI